MGTSQGKTALANYETGVSNMNKSDVVKNITSLPTKVFSIEQEKVLLLAFTNYGKQVKAGMKANDIVRSALNAASVTPYELYATTNPLFDGRPEVMPRIKALITSTFDKATLKLMDKKQSDCGEVEGKERRVAFQQANSRIKDFRNGLAKSLGIDLIAEGKALKGETSDATDEKGEKVKVNLIEQGSKNLSHSIENCDLGDVALARITKRDFNDLARILNKLMGLTEPSH